MTLSLYVSFVAYACAVTVLPGPNNVLLLSSAGQFGLRRCLPLLGGIWSGLVAVMLLAGGFCTLLETLVPQIAPAFRLVGAAYILWLAWQTLRKRPADTADSSDRSRPLTFRSGFLLQFLNVKVIMLGLASYPGYFLSAGGGLPLLLLFAITMTFCCGVGNLLWGAAGSLLYPIYSRWYKAINLVMALLLVWCAGKVAFL